MMLMINIDKNAMGATIHDLAQKVYLFRITHQFMVLFSSNEEIQEKYIAQLVKSMIELQSIGIDFMLTFKLETVNGGK